MSEFYLASHGLRSSTDRGSLLGEDSEERRGIRGEIPIPRAKLQQDVSHTKTDINQA